MNYWMNVLRGEWGFVENPKAAKRLMRCEIGHRRAVGSAV
jgi:hypothetical protein